MTANAEPLSIDAATELLTAAETAPEPEREQEEEQTEAQAAEPEAETVSEADQTAEEESAPEEASADEEAEQAEPEEVIPPPPFWDAEQKERWTKLDPATQSYILEREKQRDAAHDRAVNEAARVRKTAEAEAQKVAQLLPEIERAVQQVEQVFADQWATVDWRALAEENPAEYIRLKAVYDEDLADRQRILAAKRVAQETAAKAQEDARQAAALEEARRLRELAPELAQPEKAREVFGWLAEQGFEGDVLAGVTATELIIAHKAMLYDRLKAQGFKPKAPAPETKPAPKPISKALKPSGTGVKESLPDQRRTQLLRKRSLSVDEAMQLV